jgi:hypothetical protein
MNSSYYLKRWIDNCTESARWLRSGSEYEQFFVDRNKEALLTPEQREEKAKEYEQSAEKYREELAKFNK